MVATGKSTLAVPGSPSCSSAWQVVASPNVNQRDNTLSAAAVTSPARAWSSSPSLDAIQGDSFNPIWEEVQITFNPGFTPVQLASDTGVLAAAASGEITLTDTEEFYRCSVVGPK